jgi:malonyl-CoA/methylmalonyl-CoA synthetase
MSNHLFDAIHAKARPDAPFIETPGGRVWTYGDMLNQSARFASALVKLGVQPGDRVAVQVEKSPEALARFICR